MQKLTNKQKGILLMCLSALMFALMQIGIRLTGATVPLMEQVFFRNIVSVVLCFYLIRKKKGTYLGAKGQQPLLFCRSILGLLGLLTMFYASAHGKQADITIIFKLSPFFITILAYFFLKEKIAKVQAPALIIAFAGAFLVINPAFNTEMLPLVMALLCAIFSSFTYTLLAYAKDKVDPITVVMHFSTICTIFSIPPMLFHFVLPDIRDLLLLLFIGLCGSFGQIAITYAYRAAPASEVSIYNYSGILFSVILAFFILNETISLNTAVGGLLVIAASYLTYRFTPSDAEEI